MSAWENKNTHHQWNHCEFIKFIFSLHPTVIFSIIIQNADFVQNIKDRLVQPTERNSGCQIQRYLEY